MKQPVLNVTKCYPDAIVPQFQTHASAGLDLHAYIPDQHPLMVYPTRVELIGTGIQITSSDPVWYMLVIRSSLAVKRGFSLANSVGVIDPDYENEIKVALRIIPGIYTGTSTPINSGFIYPNERIAQLIIIPSVDILMQMKETGEVLNPYVDKERGSGGFGSTG